MEYRKRWLLVSPRGEDAPVRGVLVGRRRLRAKVVRRSTILRAPISEIDDGIYISMLYRADIPARAERRPSTILRTIREEADEERISVPVRSIRRKKRDKVRPSQILRAPVEEPDELRLLPIFVGGERRRKRPILRRSSLIVGVFIHSVELEPDRAAPRILRAADRRPSRPERHAIRPPRIFFSELLNEIPVPIVTKLDVFRYASSILGVPRPRDADEDTEVCENHNDLWPMSRRSFIEMFPWIGCIYTEELVRIGSSVNPRYQFAFAVPYDHIRTISVNGVEQSEGTSNWGLETDKITKRKRLLTNEASVVLQYIGDVLDVTGVSPLALVAMAKWLAADEGAIYNREESFIRRMRAEAGEIMSTAAAINSKGSGTAPRRIPNPILAARRGSSGGSEFFPTS